MLLVLECIKYMFMYFQQFNSKRADIFTFKATFLPHLPPPFWKDFIQNDSFIIGILNTKSGFFK